MHSSTKLSLKRPHESRKRSLSFWTFALERGMEPERKISWWGDGIPATAPISSGQTVRTSKKTFLITNCFLKGMARSTKHKKSLKIRLEKDPFVISFTCILYTASCSLQKPTVPGSEGYSQGSGESTGCGSFQVLFVKTSDMPLPQDISSTNQP